MHLEIEAAVDFLLKILSLKKKRLDLLDALGRNLACLLAERYSGHWYPERPTQGQAYRCIRINPWQYVDESLLKACTLCGLEYSKLPLPDEMTLWIDPYEVCGRFGEHTDYFTIATFEPVVYEEPAHIYPEIQTSDYSSDGPSSESVSDNSSDEEASGEKPMMDMEEVDGPLNCSTPDEAIDSPKTSKAGTPVPELLASEEQKISTDAPGTQDTAHV
ncbi:maternal B9.10 protein-like [Gastrophryne carolinensis]